MTTSEPDLGKAIPGADASAEATQHFIETALTDDLVDLFNHLIPEQQQRRYFLFELLDWPL